MQHSERSQPSFTRPDLLSTPSPGGAESSRILAALESGAAGVSAYGKKSKGRAGWRRFTVGALVLLGGLATWIVHQNNAQVPAQQGPRLAVPEKLQSAQQVAVAAENDGQPAAPSEPEAGSQAAFINEEPTSKIASALDPGAGFAIPKQTQAVTIDSASASSTGTLLEALEGTGTNTIRASASAAATGPKANQPASGQVIRKPQPARPKQARNSKTDSDVALLTALVAAANEQEPAKPALPVPPNSGEAGKKLSQPNRDIVERTANDSTESLLARCKRLGFLEGELCRWRICSGQDSDPACKVP